MTRYVVGIAFDAEATRVVPLLKQTGPDCVLDRWNGPGGKIEPGEDPDEAMSREFREETGVQIPASRWKDLCILRNTDYEIHFLYVRDDAVLQAQAVTNEVPRIFWVDDVPWDDAMPNLRWMIPLVQDTDIVDPFVGTLVLQRR